MKSQKARKGRKTNTLRRAAGMMKYRPASTSLQKYQPTKVSAGKELLVIYIF